MRLVFLIIHLLLASNVERWLSLSMVERCEPVEEPIEEPIVEPLEDAPMDDEGDPDWEEATELRIDELRCNIAESREPVCTKICQQ